VFTLLALIAGVYCGIHFANFTADFLEERLKITSPYMPVISFAATFIVVVIGVYFAGKLLTKVVKIASLEFLNKLAGAIFSSCKYLIIISITLVIIKAVNGHLNFIPKEAREKSMLLEPLTELSISLFPFIVNSKFWEHIPKSEEGLESPESSEI
jgi:membrane protein required for colicin V production